jgi:membrane carboxypeptidase/penicillin-binding protein
MSRTRKPILIAIAVLLLAVIAFEGFALWRAQQRTPEVLSEASKGPLPLSALSAQQIQELLAVEDPGFYRHQGVDFSTPGAGMTTITQSLVKHFYFDHFHKGFPKIEQSLIARFVLDPAMSKPDQLHSFINHAYFGTYRGKNVEGFAAAATIYFGQDFDQLTNDQFLTLVAMLMAPDRLDPDRHSAANRERVARIKRMLSGECRPAGLRDVSYKACASTPAGAR